MTEERRDDGKDHRRASDGTVAQGDLADGEAVLGVGLTDAPHGTPREVVLRERDREAHSVPPDGPGPADVHLEFSGPHPAERCAPEDFHAAEDVAPGIGAAVDRCLDETGDEGAFVRQVMTWVPATGHSFWLIGGAVRDLVDIGPAARPNDLDFAGTLPPLRLRQELDLRSDLAGLGDYRARVSPVSLVAHLSRPEQGGGGRVLEYKALAVTDFRFSAYGGGLAEDVTSRDLTINSLYYDHGRHVLADPTGQGLAHLRSRPKVLATRNTERAPGRSAQLLMRFLKFGVRYPDADTSRLREWAARLPDDLLDRLTERDWPALEWGWRKTVPEAGRKRARQLAADLGPVAQALVHRLDGPGETGGGTSGEGERA
ncbi:hypothetical protein ABII15_30185 [Streptomyces sp. HUAS MG91]|uniref:Poly A polymerase head domain-containing protein n=1 Tax=Streptomyces tabacisoli TaxID=3156398 RepID=A0AAU8J0E2_9ACTN